MEENKLPKKELIHDLDSPQKKGSPNSNMTKQLVFTVIIVLILGIGTGYIASNVAGSGEKGSLSVNNSSSGGSMGKGFTAGVNDTKAFPDTAEGVLQIGGIDGEGAFHLVRPGGDSQNVYMTSSAVDLSQFIGKKVKVWGQTQTAQKAGWLMDVGKIQVL
jgi:hypothetical protein